MTTQTQGQDVGDISDVAETVAELVDRGLAREAEVVMAFLALWLLDRVEAGRTPREVADTVFTQLDARLSGLPGAAALSEESQELVIEGEHFHHFGEMEGPVTGPDPTYLRQLAYSILQRDGNGAAR